MSGIYVLYVPIIGIHLLKNKFSIKTINVLFDV
jgi:hypothetical protein